MAAGTDAIYTRNVKSPFGAILSAANASSQGGGTIGTDIFLAGTAGSVDGSFSVRVRFYLTATTPTTSTAAVARIFVSSVSSGATTSANTMCIGDVVLGSLSAASTTVNTPHIDFFIGVGLEASRSILVTTSVAPAANTAWRAILLGHGDY